MGSHAYTDTRRRKGKLILGRFSRSRKGFQAWKQNPDLKLFSVSHRSLPHICTGVTFPEPEHCGNPTASYSSLSFFLSPHGGNICDSQLSSIYCGSPTNGVSKRTALYTSLPGDASLVFAGVGEGLVCSTSDCLRKLGSFLSGG